MYYAAGSVIGLDDTFTSLDVKCKESSYTSLYGCVCEFLSVLHCAHIAILV